MDRRVMILMALLPLALALPLGAAEEPLGDCFHVDVAGELYVTGTGTAYVESNGMPGLQRGAVTLLGDVEPCPSRHAPDMMVL